MVRSLSVVGSELSGLRPSWVSRALGVSLVPLLICLSLFFPCQAVAGIHFQDRDEDGHRWERRHSATVSIDARFENRVRRNMDLILLVLALKRYTIVSWNLQSELTADISDAHVRFDRSGTRKVKLPVGEHPYDVAGRSSYRIQFQPPGSASICSAEYSETYRGHGTLRIHEDEAGKNVRLRVWLGDAWLQGLGWNSSDAFCALSFRARLLNPEDELFRRGDDADGVCRQWNDWIRTWMFLLYLESQEPAAPLGGLLRREFSNASERVRRGKGLRGDRAAKMLQGVRTDAYRKGLAAVSGDVRRRGEREFRQESDRYAKSAGSNLARFERKEPPKTSARKPKAPAGGSPYGTMSSATAPTTTSKKVRPSFPYAHPVARPANPYGRDFREPIVRTASNSPEANLHPYGSPSRRGTGRDGSSAYGGGRDRMRRLPVIPVNAPSNIGRRFVGLGSLGSLTLTETNNTAYIISVQLTGPTVMTVLVDPHSQRVVHVAPGSYNVFASVPGNPQITPKSMEAKFQAGYKYDEPWFIVPKARA